MLSITLPPFLSRFMDWAEANPALGVISVLVGIVVLLWIIRKSMKFFMVVVGLMALTILGSYFFYGPEKTNQVVRDQTEKMIEQGKDIVNEGVKKANEAIQESATDSEK
jgi:flagellar motor component MotA